MFYVQFFLNLIIINVGGTAALKVLNLTTDLVCCTYILL